MSKFGKTAPNPGPILIEAGHVLDVSGASMSAVRRADVLVQGGSIVKVAPGLAREYPAARRLDAAGCLVMPGLTNAHTHSPENFAAGFCDALRLESVVSLTGRVVQRSPETVNPNLATGEVELAIETLELLSVAEPLPVPVNSDAEYHEAGPAAAEETNGSALRLVPTRVVAAPELAPEG